MDGPGTNKDGARDDGSIVTDEFGTDGMVEFDDSWFFIANIFSSN